ncbi:MAG: hypothetical protein ACKKL5_00185 [Candidatus Komeilibacteria bacterium]
MNTVDQIMDKIEEKKLQPHSLRYWQLRRFLTWSLFVLFIILAAIAAAIALFVSLNLDWDIAWELASSAGEYVVLLVPLFWFMAIIVAIVLSWWRWRQTEHGHRQTWLLVIGLSIAASLVLGIGVYAAGWGESLDRNLADKVSLYHDQRLRQQHLWQRPDDGFWIGEIKEIDQHLLRMQDMQAKYWQVEWDNAKLPPRWQPAVGRWMKVRGENYSDDFIQALEIRPAGGMMRGSNMKTFPRY